MEWKKYKHGYLSLKILLPPFSSPTSLHSPHIPHLTLLVSILYPVESTYSQLIEQRLGLGHCGRGNGFAIYEISLDWILYFSFNVELIERDIIVKFSRKLVKIENKFLG